MERRPEKVCPVGKGPHPDLEEREGGERIDLRETGRRCSVRPFDLVPGLKPGVGRRRRRDS